MNQDIIKTDLRDFQVKRLEEIAEEKKTNVIAPVIDRIKKEYFFLLGQGDSICTNLTASNDPKFFHEVAKVVDDKAYIKCGPSYKLDEITAMYIVRGDIELVYDERKSKA
jgi:hypothetical protein